MTAGSAHILHPLAVFHYRVSSFYPVYRYKKYFIILNQNIIHRGSNFKYEKSRVILLKRHLISCDRHKAKADISTDTFSYLSKFLIRQKCSCFAVWRKKQKQIRNLSKLLNVINKFLLNSNYYFSYFIVC